MTSGEWLVGSGGWGVGSGKWGVVIMEGVNDPIHVAQKGKHCP